MPRFSDLVGAGSDDEPESDQSPPASDSGDSTPSRDSTPSAEPAGPHDPDDPSTTGQRIARQSAFDSLAAEQAARDEQESAAADKVEQLGLADLPTVSDDLLPGG